MITRSPKIPGTTSVSRFSGGKAKVRATSNVMLGAQAFGDRLQSGEELDGGEACAARVDREQREGGAQTPAFA